MKQIEVSQARMRQVIESIRRIPCYTNEHCFQLSIKRCDRYGFRLTVFPSDRWPWWDESDVDYFRCFAIGLNVGFTIHVENGMPVAEFSYHQL